jgi:hypothetical protein
MEGIGVHIVAALVLIGVGCCATVLSVYVFPLSVRVRGQRHGRFAGLCLPQRGQSATTPAKEQVAQNPVPGGQICT